MLLHDLHAQRHKTSAPICGPMAERYFNSSVRILRATRGTTLHPPPTSHPLEQRPAPPAPPGPITVGQQTADSCS